MTFSGVWAVETEGDTWDRHPVLGPYRGRWHHREQGCVVMMLGTGFDDTDNEVGSEENAHYGGWQPPYQNDWRQRDGG